MTPQELKNSILQLAIQGKLVEQRPEEGTAEELFARIQEEKQRLIAEKKIKKGKPLPEITEDEKPFDIPENWKWVRLGSIISISSGDGSTSKEMDEGGSYPVYGGNGINGHHNSYNISKRTLVIGRVGFYCGSTYITENKAWVTDNAFITAFDEDRIDMKWLKFYIDYLNPRKKASSTAQPVISGKLIYPMLVPLPPLAEQKRIVAKIEELLPYIDRYEQAWSKLEQFNSRFPEDMKKSLLQYAIQGKLVEQRPEEGTGEELFAQIQEEKQQLVAEKKIKKEKPLPEITEDEKPFDIPESWKWVRCGEIGFTHIGLTYSPKNVSEEGIIVLRSSNIQNQHMDYQDIVRVDMDIPENKMCHIGDILICARNGSKRLVGKAALVDKEGMSFGAFMAIYRSKCNAYILHVINSAYFRNSLLGDTGTTTINQITQDMLKNALFPLPPLAEQKRIVEKLEQLLPLCERLK